MRIPSLNEDCARAYLGKLRAIPRIKTKIIHSKSYRELNIYGWCYLMMGNDIGKENWRDDNDQERWRRSKN